MEALTRLVTDSLVRHGFNRPIDPRRLQWTRWFLCDSPHSLLVVPSKPGIFAIAEEIASFGGSPDAHGAADALVRRESQDASRATSDREGHDLGRAAKAREGNARRGNAREGHDFSRAVKATDTPAALAAEAISSKRMLAVLQFSEDDDMAFTLDRMFTKPNPLRERLSAGRCFLRFVVIEDQDQRRSICNLLNQWLLSSAEKASGLPPSFASSLEMSMIATRSNEKAPIAPAHLDSGANKNLHCPQPLPSGF
jgi:hypothetical protein